MSVHQEFLNSRTYYKAIFLFGCFDYFSLGHSPVRSLKTNGGFGDSLFNLNFCNLHDHCSDLLNVEILQNFVDVRSDDLSQFLEICVMPTTPILV